MRFFKELVKICNDQKLNVIKACLNIPYSPNNFDYTMCIAVIHHLSTECKRKLAINELVHYKPGGKILILVWALEQELDSKRKFDKQDNYIDWRDKSKKLLGKRYCHVFKKGELSKILF